VARLTSVAILKGIQQIEIPLDDVALLIGANNSGKASQLCTSDAQSRALGKQYWKRTAKLLLEYGACSGNAGIRASFIAKDRSPTIQLDARDGGARGTGIQHSPP
jgi:hypothetical protein